MKLTERPRRLRKSPFIRETVAETRLDASQLVLPLFVTEGKDKVEAIGSMPGVNRYSLDRLPKFLGEAAEHGVKSVVIFPRINDELKDPTAREAMNAKGL